MTTFMITKNVANMSNQTELVHPDDSPKTGASSVDSPDGGLRVPAVTTARSKLRLYGPYRHGQKWRVQVKSENGSVYQMFSTFGEASKYVLANAPVEAKQRKKRGASWVYFVQCVDHNGYIKIGYSRDSGSRLAALQMGCPYDLVLLAEFRTTEPSLFEAEIHERYQHLNVRGEWFRPEPELLELVNSLPSRAEMVRGVLHADDESTESSP